MPTKYNTRLAHNGQSIFRKNNQILLVIEPSIVRLETYLIGHGWHIDYSDDHERAKRKIEKIEPQTAGGIFQKLQHAKSEAETWASNEQYDLSGQHLKISKAQQRQARTDTHRIN